MKNLWREEKVNSPRTENESVSVRQCVNAREHLFAFSQSKRNPLIEYSAHNIMVRREERRRRNEGNENRLVVPVRGTTTAICHHLTYCARRQCVSVCVMKGTTLVSS